VDVSVAVRTITITDITGKETAVAALRGKGVGGDGVTTGEGKRNASVKRWRSVK
jgi:hypothetical protein